MRRAAKREPARTIIYVRGTDQEIEDQLNDAYAGCQRAGHCVVGVMREQPGGTEVWHDAQRLLRHGKIDLVYVSSGTAVPGLLESATGGIPGTDLLRGIAAGVRRSARRRRIRPMRRGGGEA